MRKKFSLIGDFLSSHIMTILIISILIISFILSIAVRISTVKSIEDITKVSNLTIETNKEDDDFTEDVGICKEELSESPIVLLASFTGNRESRHYSTISTMRIIKIIKSNRNISDTYINVYENNSIGSKHGKLYLRNFTPVNFFVKDNTYLLFLNDCINYDEDYKSAKNIKFDEYALTSFFVSSFCISNTKSTVLDMNTINTVNFNKYYNNEFIVFSDNQSNMLYEFKKDILSQYLQ